MNRRSIIIALGIIVLVLIIVADGLFFGKQILQNWNKQPVVPENFSVDDCRLLSARDVKSMLGGGSAVEGNPLKLEGRCRETLINFSGEGQNATPKNIITLNIIDSKVSADYNKDPKDFLNSICLEQSLQIGDYNSCNMAEFIFFGKGKYLLQLSCTNCTDQELEKLSKLVAGRI
jgi:hypothetical protein